MCVWAHRNRHANIAGHPGAGLFLVRIQDYVPGKSPMISSACGQSGQSQDCGIVQAGTALGGYCSKEGQPPGQKILPVTSWKRPDPVCTTRLKNLLQSLAVVLGESFFLSTVQTSFSSVLCLLSSIFPSLQSASLLINGS